MNITDFDDVLGSSEAPPRRGRPTNEERERRRQEVAAQADFQAAVRNAGRGHGEFQAQDFFGLCTKNQIARLMHMDPMTLNARLEKCKPAGMVGSGRPVYYFHEVIPYIVKPKMDIGTYLKTLNPGDMPNSINKTFWEAERIKNKVLIETGEAWHDADVLEVLGSVFMLFKDRLPLITEGMREAGLTDEQFEKLQEFTDQLQKDLYAELVELPKKRQTRSRAAGINVGEDVVGEAGE